MEMLCCELRCDFELFGGQNSLGRKSRSGNGWILPPAARGRCRGRPPGSPKAAMAANAKGGMGKGKGQGFSDEDDLGVVARVTISVDECG